MHTEWIKVMLEEIARNREEAERGRDEEAKRACRARGRGQRGRVEGIARGEPQAPLTGPAGQVTLSPLAAGRVPRQMC